MIGKEVMFCQIDVTDEVAVGTTFAHHNIDSIIHFAGLKAAGKYVKKTPDLKELCAPTGYTEMKIITKSLKKLVLLIHKSDAWMEK